MSSLKNDFGGDELFKFGGLYELASQNIIKFHCRNTNHPFFSLNVDLFDIQPKNYLCGKCLSTLVDVETTTRLLHISKIIHRIASFRIIRQLMDHAGYLESVYEYNTGRVRYINTALDARAVNLMGCYYFMKIADLNESENYKSNLYIGKRIFINYNDVENLNEETQYSYLGYVNAIDIESDFLKKSSSEKKEIFTTFKKIILSR